jgi:hypothetical protein
MLAFDAHSDIGVVAAMRRRPLLRLLESRVVGGSAVRPASFRSIGIGEARRAEKLLRGLLDGIGAPDGRQPGGAGNPLLPGVTAS